MLTLSTLEKRADKAIAAKDEDKLRECLGIAQTLAWSDSARAGRLIDRIMAVLNANVRGPR